MKVLAATLVLKETSVVDASSALHATTMTCAHRVMKRVQQPLITQQDTQCSVFLLDQILNFIMVVNR